MEKIQDYKYWLKRKKEDLHLDWNNQESNWINGYWRSRNHPHRKHILNKLEELNPFESLIEVGSNCGPNLALISQKFPNVSLAGIDINKTAILEGREKLPQIDFRRALAWRIPFPKKSFDILLTDAVLLYVSPKKIMKTIQEFLRVAKKAIILIEWHSENEILGKIEFHHWVRDYKKLFSLFGLQT